MNYTLDIPDETVKQYQIGALAAGKKLESFIVDRLIESPLPIVAKNNKLKSDELALLEKLDNEELLQIAQSVLPSDLQKTYDHLLEENVNGRLNSKATALLHEIGEQARYLTLKRSHAYMLLRWRGVSLPSPNELDLPE